MARPRLRSVLLSSAVIAPTVVVCVAGPASADVTSVAGGAFGISAAVTVPVTGALGLAPSPSVVLPTTGGGPITRTAAKATVGSLASTGVLTVSTSGDAQVSHGRTTRSSATVDALNVAGRLSASTVTSRCTSNGDGSSGSTTLEGVTGIVTATVPAPNTVVQLPGVGSVTLNEQTVTSQPGANSAITVNAIDVRIDPALLPGTSGQIIVGQSRCGALGPDVLTGAGAAGSGSGSQPLPRTGTNLVPPAAAGGALLLVGLGLVASARRRRSLAS